MFRNQTHFQAIIFIRLFKNAIFISSLEQLQNGRTNELIGSTYLTNTLLANI